MQEWQQRVVTERDELCEKLAKLRQFKNTADFAKMDREPRDLMEKQENCMQHYADVLGARIALFK